MCRGVWGLAVGPDQEACDALRRAAGDAVEIVAMAASPAQARERASELPLDVAVIDARTADAYGVVAALVRRPIAIVWVGEDAPGNVHEHVASLDEDLGAAVSRAILARKRN